MQILEWCAAHKTVLIIAAVAVVVLAVIIGVAVGVHKRRKKSAIGKLFKTTDGFLRNYPPNKKQRRVVAVAQRTKDGAIAIVKLYKLKDKENKVGKNYIPDLVLSPDDHSSLSESTIVGRQVLIGIKKGDTFIPIYVSDLEATGDELTDEELKKVLKEVNNYKPEHRRTHKRKMRRWRRGFKEKKQ